MPDAELTRQAARRYDGTDPGLPGGWIHDDRTPCPEYLAPDNGTRWWCTEHQQYLRRPDTDYRLPPLEDYPGHEPYCTRFGCGLPVGRGRDGSGLLAHLQPPGDGHPVELAWRDREQVTT